MTESPSSFPPEPDKDRKKDKHKNKVRAAWISFLGRIVAQVVGAIATIALGFMIARNYNAPAPEPAPVAPDARPVNAPGGRVAIAVLPLNNFSARPDQEYFADGMTESLISVLAQIDGLKVISRTSVMRYKEVPQPIPVIARELGVDYVVEGSVVRADGRVRITAQLIDARTDTHVWAGTFDRAPKDILTTQAEVAKAIAAEVHVVLLPDRVLQADVHPEAYDAYLRALQAVRSGNVSGGSEAVTLLERSTTLDPGFAPAWARLADTYVLMGSFVVGAIPARNAAEKGKAAATKALSLDPGLAEAHTSLGWIEYRYEWKWTSPEDRFRRAISLNAGSEQARQYYAIYLSERGRDREAMVQGQAALELDPLSAASHRILAILHYNAGRFAEVESPARKSLELDPSNALAKLLLAWSLTGQNRAAESSELLSTIPETDRNGEVWASLAEALVAAGRKEQALPIRQRLERGGLLASAPALVRLYLALGETDLAFRALNRAVDERSDLACLLNVSPMLRSIRSDPRFAALLRRTGNG